MNKVKRKPKHPRPEAKVPSAPCSLNKSLHEQAGLASVWKNANHRTDEREIAPAEDGETIEITTMADLAEVVSEVKFLLR